VTVPSRNGYLTGVANGVVPATVNLSTVPEGAWMFAVLTIGQSGVDVSALPLGWETAMPGPAYETIAVHGTPVTVPSATRTNTTVAVPSGASAGDLLVVALSVGNASAVAPSAPAGQTWGSLGVTYSAPDPWAVQEWLFWHVIQPGETSYTFTHASALSQAYAEAYSGVDTTNPLDVAGQTNSQGISEQSGNATLPAFTTVTPGALLVINRGSWDGNAITPPSDFTERSDSPVLWYGTRTIASPGSTGAISIPAGNNGNNYPWGIVGIVLRPAVSTAVRQQRTGTRTSSIAKRVKNGDTSVSWNGSASANKRLTVFWGTGAVPDASEWLTGTIGVRNASDAVPGQSVQAGDSTHSTAPALTVPEAGGLLLAIGMEATIAGPSAGSVSSGNATLWFNVGDETAYIEQHSVAYVEDPDPGSYGPVSFVYGSTQANNGFGVLLFLPAAATEVDPHEGTFSGSVDWVGSFTGDAPEPGVSSGTFAGAVAWTGAFEGERPTVPGFPSVAAVLAQLGGATIAHRNIAMPRSSMRQVQAAVDMGHGMLEASVGFTGDSIATTGIPPQPFLLGDQYLNQQSELTGPNIDPRTLTWAQIQANYQITRDAGGVPEPYVLLKDVLDAFPHHVFCVDPKYGVQSATYLNALWDVLQPYKDRVIVKFDSPNITVAQSAAAAGFEHRMNFWWDDTASMAAQQSYWTIIGAEWDNAAALAQAGTYGKPVWSAIVTTQEQYDLAVQRGADLVMVADPSVAVVPYAGGHAAEFHGSVSWEGSFTAKRAPVASFAGSFRLAGAFTAARASKAAYAGVVAWTGAFSAQRRARASFAGAVAWSGAFASKRHPYAVFVGGTSWGGLFLARRASIATFEGSTTWEGTFGTERGARATFEGSTSWAGAFGAQRASVASFEGLAAWEGAFAAARASLAAFEGSHTWAGWFTAGGTATATFAGAVAWSGAFAAVRRPVASFAGHTAWAGEFAAARASLAEFTGSVEWTGHFAGPTPASPVYFGDVAVVLRLGDVPVILG